MKILIAIAPEKFRDEELAEPVAALQKAGIGFDIASTRHGPCTGMLGAKADAALSFEEVSPGRYDGLIIGLGVTTATVDTHVRHCLEKLGARNRAYAIALGLRAGEITLDLPAVGEP